MNKLKTCKVCKKRYRPKKKSQTKCNQCLSSLKASINIRRCKRCKVDKPLTDYLPRKQICINCGLFQSKSFLHILAACKRTNTTHCFPTLDSLISFDQLRTVKYNYKFASRICLPYDIPSNAELSEDYPKDSKYHISEHITKKLQQLRNDHTLTIPANIHIAHYQPLSIGGTCAINNLFITTALLNQIQGNRNSVMYPDHFKQLHLAPTLSSVSSLEVHKELVNRFGSDYPDYLTDTKVPTPRLLSSNNNNNNNTDISSIKDRFIKHLVHKGLFNKSYTYTLQNILNTVLKAHNTDITVLYHLDHDTLSNELYQQELIRHNARVFHLQLVFLESSQAAINATFNRVGPKYNDIDDRPLRAKELYSTVVSQKAYFQTLNAYNASVGLPRASQPSSDRYYVKSTYFNPLLEIHAPIYCEIPILPSVKTLAKQYPYPIGESVKVQSDYVHFSTPSAKANVDDYREGITDVEYISEY